MNAFRLAVVFLCLQLSLAARAEDLGKELREAASRGDIESVKALLEKGADINAKDELGRSALLVVVSNAQKEMARLLIERGADVNTRDATFGITPFAYAMWTQNSETALLLIRNGAEPNMALISGATAGAAPLVEAALGTNKVHARGLTCALSVAEHSGHKEIAERLKQAGARPAAQLDNATLEKFAGIYEGEDGSEFTFYTEDGKLMFEAIWGLQELIPWDSTTLILPANAIHESFEEELFRFRLEGNRVVGVVHEVDGKESVLQKVEED